MDFPRLRQVGDTGVRAHQHVDGVQGALQKPFLGLRQVDSAQRGLGKVVVRHQSQAVEADGVNGVHGLQNPGHPLETLEYNEILQLAIKLKIS